ncbi:hypothetical protein D3C73_1224230 [compost metagenome]
MASYSSRAAKGLISATPRPAPTSAHTDEPRPASATVCRSTLADLKTASIFSRSGVALGKAMKGSPAKSAGLSFLSLVRRCPLGSTATQFIVITGST